MRTASLLERANAEAGKEVLIVDGVRDQSSAIVLDFSATQIILGTLVLASVFAIGVISARFIRFDASKEDSLDDEDSPDKLQTAGEEQADEPRTGDTLPFQCQPTEYRGSVTIRKMRIPSVTIGSQESMDSFSEQASIMGAEWTIADDSEEYGSTASQTKMQTVWSQATSTSSCAIEETSSLLEGDGDDYSDDNSEPSNTLIVSSPRTLGIQSPQAGKTRRGPGRALRKKPANPIPFAVQEEMEDEDEEITLSETVSNGAQESRTNDGTHSTSSRGGRHTWHQGHGVDEDDEEEHTSRVRFRTEPERVHRAR